VKQKAEKQQEKRNVYQEGFDRHISFMRDFIQGNNGEEEYFVKDESRVTKIGRVLRKHSLDELPQLINVLRGEMSLVGPRFCSVEEYGFYKPWHMRRFSVKPGMTGLWQVRARSEVSYDDMVMLDFYYIEKQSLLFDFEILLRTITVVLFGKGSRVD
jgi:lipopolysaccharide/colanic/teichoic acid biosynthesis glycosyltransferase